jgi:hypothetical protein
VPRLDIRTDINAEGQERKGAVCMCMKSAERKRARESRVCVWITCVCRSVWNVQRDGDLERVGSGVCVFYKGSVCDCVCVIVCDCVSRPTSSSSPSKADHRLTCLAAFYIPVLRSGGRQIQDPSKRDIGAIKAPYVDAPTKGEEDRNGRAAEDDRDVNHSARA